VGVCYQTKVDPFAPAESTAVTGSDGTAAVSVAPYPAGKRLYVRVAAHHESRAIAEGDLASLPRWWPWPFNRTGPDRPADFAFEVPSQAASVAPAR
jgi:hypothetical protein